MSNNLVLDYALKYLKRGLSIIPIEPGGKKPIEVGNGRMKWEAYQNEPPTEEEVMGWFENHPDRNIAMVCGAVSGRLVGDLDIYKDTEIAHQVKAILDKEGIKPMVKTPRGGWHYWFEYTTDLGQKKVPGLDIKSDGGYVLLPPSVVDGKEYEYRKGNPKAVLSSSLIKYIENNTKSMYRGGLQTGVNDCKSDLDKIHEGERDDKIFHYSNIMSRGPVSEREQTEILTKIALYACDPPFDRGEVGAKIASAISRQEVQRENLSQEVRDFVLANPGKFSAKDCYESLNIANPKQKALIRVVLSKMVKEEQIEKDPFQHGLYRVPDLQLEKIDLENVTYEDAGVWLPFGLSERVFIMPKNIIIVAGVQNAGKTSFLMNCLRENLKRGKDCVYFSSEMGSMEMKVRVDQFPDWPRKKFDAYERSTNFSDVIEPNKINIIDYLELDDKAYHVARHLKYIHDKLRKGVAIIALQKDPDKEVGRGASYSLEKPRLYLTLDMEDEGMVERRVCRVKKAKNLNTQYPDINRMQIYFDIIDGGEIREGGKWHPDPRKRRRQA